MKLQDVVKQIEDVIILNEDMAMLCRNDIISINGVQTTLYYQERIHTKEHLKQAKHKARNMWDIVRFNVVKIRG